MDNWLIEKMSRFKDKTAVIYKDKKYSYAELLNDLNTNNVKQGEVAAILADCSFKSIALFLALMGNKNIIVPISATSDDEIRERLEESFADKKIVLENESVHVSALNNVREKHDLIRRIQKIGKSGLVLFSSGSTGKPKAMLHDLDNLIEVFKTKKERDSNILVFMLFDHIGGINTLLNALSSGSTITIPENRNPDYICELIEKHRVTLLPATPTFLNLLLLSEAYLKRDLTSLKMITYGTETMPEHLLQRLKKVLTDVEFLQTFGTSETGITKTSSRSSTSTFLKINDPGCEFKIVDGELWLKSKTQILGYLNCEMDNFSEDGWYRTGDLVEKSEEGFMKIIGRTKEVINVGGEKVLPSEVESVLFEMPEIADCQAHGEKNAIIGQIVVADVVLSDINSAGSIKKEIRKYCRGKIDAYKIPVKVNVVNKIDFSDRFKRKRRKN
jgi:acyl-coenzyme A synthetase/AMP-(fatty) acid ligase